MSNCRNKRGQFARCQVGKAPSRGRRTWELEVQLNDAVAREGDWITTGAWPKFDSSTTSVKLEHTKGIIRIAIPNPNPNGYEGQVLVEFYDGIPRVHIWDGSTDTWDDDPASSTKINKRKKR